MAGPLSAEALQRSVRRNTALLALANALNWAVIVLVASLTTLTIGRLFALPELAGLGIALYLLAFAAGGLIAGRAMDAWGRRSGLLAAFLAGAGGAVLVYFGVGAALMLVALLGLLLVGLGTGGANLARVAGADMYRPERRARGISMVVFGAAFGAIGVPIVFAPVLAGARAYTPAALAAPWLIGAGLLLAGGLVVLAIRPDPRQIAEQLRSLVGAASAAQPRPAVPPRPISTLMSLPMVPLAVLAAVISQAVMTAVMALTGLILADHGHDLGAISLTLSLHFVGMFGLVLFVGPLVERIGRFRAVVLGLLVLAAGVLALLPGPDLGNFIAGLFAVGVGWNIAFVASTTILADAAQPSERGRLLGFSDFLAIAGAAAWSIAAGLILIIFGLAALVVAAVLLALIPAGLIAINRKRLEGLPLARPSP